MCNMFLPPHTVAIWTFPFHQNSEKKQRWFSKLDPRSVKPWKIIFLTNNMKKKCWLMKRRYYYHFLCVAEVEEVESEVQVILEAKLINILIWNFDFLNSFLFYFLQELRNPLLSVAAITKSWNIRVAVWHKKVDWHCFSLTFGEMEMFK